MLDAVVELLRVADYGCDDVGVTLFFGCDGLRLVAAHAPDQGDKGLITLGLYVVRLVSWSG